MSGEPTARPAGGLHPGRILAALALAAMLAVLGWQSLQYGLGYASIVCVVGTVVAAVGMVVSLRSGAAVEAVNLPLGAAGMARLVGFALVWGLYIVALPMLGFIVTTFVALAASTALAAGRVRPGGLLATAAFVIVFALLIKAVLYVPVPQGWLDQKLEVLVYRQR